MTRGTVHMLALAAVLLGGCASDTVPDYRPADGTDTALIRRLAQQPRLVCDEAQPIGTVEMSRHVLIVDARGDLDSVSGSLSDTAVYPTQFRRIADAYVDFLNDPAFAPGNALNRMLIYVNGGLNEKARVLDQARAQIPCIKRAGFFPVFLIWRTGAIETYAEQIGKVRNGRLEDDWQLTAPFYLAGDLGQGIARAPITYSSSIALFAGTQGPAGAEYRMSGHRWRYRPGTPPAHDNNLLFEDSADLRSGNGAGALLYALLLPVRALTSPFVDSIGHTAWENMMRRSRITVRRAREFDADPAGAPPSPDPDYPEGTAAFSKFFADLQNCARPQASGAPRPCLGGPAMAARSADMKLTVIGHSMGTIVLDELIPIYHRLDYRNIVYMASAASIRDFRHSVVPLIEARPAVRFYNLSLHPMADAREVAGYGVVQSGSLLEWIDDMYEQPRTMMDRTLGKWRNIRLAKHVFPSAAQRRMIFKVFGFRPEEGVRGQPGYRPGDPVRHGQFNDTRMHYWLPEFWGEADIAWP